MAINKPGAFCTVTGSPNKEKFNCLKRMVKHGPRKRPICRQPRIFARSCVRVSGVDRREISANNGG
jgi:hypothetical protein